MLYPTERQARQVLADRSQDFTVLCAVEDGPTQRNDVVRLIWWVPETLVAAAAICDQIRELALKDRTAFALPWTNSCGRGTLGRWSIASTS